jgi:hypothetical protein
VQVTAQFADSLYSLERLQALRLALWGGASVVLGTGQLAFLRLASRESRVVLHFGVQCALWGALWILVAMIWRNAVPLRDLAGAVALDRAVWFALGAAASLTLGSATLILFARGTPDRASLLGAGVGTLTQALATAVLAAQLSVAIVR